VRETETKRYTILESYRDKGKNSGIKISKKPYRTPGKTPI
jgi:hypothetical protein